MWNFYTRWHTQALVLTATFAVLFCSHTVWSQVSLRGSVSVLAVNTDGAPLGDATVRLDRLNDQSIPVQTWNGGVPDSRGRFSFSGLPEGKYLLHITHQFFGPPVERRLNLLDKTEVNLTVELGRACINGVTRDSGQVTDEDKAEVARIALRDAIDYLLPATERTKTLILANMNIKPEWMRAPDRSKILLMDPSSIVNKANNTGNFQYLLFSEFRVVGGCISVSIDHVWAFSAESMVVHSSGAGITMQFLRENGKWRGTRVNSWVS